MTVYIGLMSGTSLDGIDGVIVDFSGGIPRLCCSLHHPFPVLIEKALQSLQVTHATTLHAFGELQTALAECYAVLVRDLLHHAKLQSSDIAAIGNHGQTIFHAPHSSYPFTLQIGNHSVLAAKTGIPVVGDFRSLDVAYGGEGAPLAPLFLQTYFSEPSKKKAFLNLGGIANVSIFNGQDLISAFDTGPANGLMDEWTRLHFKQNYDENGALAASGTIIASLLQSLLSDPYFTASAPKSTGREYFSLSRINAAFTLEQYDPKDVLRTLSELTAQSISQALSPFNMDEIWVSGGGVFNTHLCSRLQALNPHQVVQSIAKKGWDPQLIEPIAFAWLAKSRLQNIVFDLRKITGCKTPHTLGIIFSTI